MTSTTASSWAEKKKRLDNMAKPTRVLRLCGDADVRDRYLAARQAHTRAQDYLNNLGANTDPDARALVKKQVVETAAELDEATQAYDAITVVLTFQALEREDLEDLIKEHPATEEDEEKGSDFHFDTFAPELIAAASVDGMPVEDAADALKTWTLSDSEDLWNAAWSVQRRKRTDLGKG